MIFRRIYIVALVVFLPFIGIAQDREFTASAPASVQVGQQFQYTISGNQRGDISLPESSDFDFLGGPYSNFSSSTQWINGKMTATTTASYTYLMRANKTGDLVIPPATVKVKRESFATNAVKISVQSQSNTRENSGAATESNVSNASSSSELPVFLRIQPSKREVYVGEQLVSELKVYTSVNTQPTSGLKEVPYEGFYKHTLDGDQSSQRENINGKVHVTQVLQRHILIPQKSGKIVIEPFESEWAIPQRISSSGRGGFFDDPFSDPFFDRVRNVPTKISTNPITIQVKPLPSNAPDGFNGGVGDFEMSASLTQDNVNVNDALSLKVTVTGTGNLTLLGAPKVDFPPDHDVYETTKNTKISTSGNRITGSVTFEYPIVARHAGRYRIAPVKFSWFDPETASYKTMTSSEFIFTVEKAEGVEQQTQIYMPGSRGEEVHNIGTDILDIIRTVPVFIPKGKTPLTATWYWVLYGIIFLLFLLMIVLLRTYFRQKADIRLSRNKKANKMARGRLKMADKARKANDDEKFFEETEKAIWGYLADKLSIEISLLSRETIQEVLRSAKISDELQEELIGIIETCEFSRYAPSSRKADMEKLYMQTIALIRNLEHNIRTK